jgi:hypothetical protein
MLFILSSFTIINSTVPVVVKYSAPCYRLKLHFLSVLRFISFYQFSGSEQNYDAAPNPNPMTVQTVEINKYLKNVFKTVASWPV